MKKINYDKLYKRGYDIFIANGSEYYIPDALHIEKLDEMNLFEDDDQASIQAEKDGIKFINDMEGVPKRVYIDTEENRKIIVAMLELYPEYKKWGNVN